MDDKLLAIERKKLIKKLLDELMKSMDTLYYVSTAEIAAAIFDLIQQKTSINHQEYEQLKGLSSRDIEVILSFK